MSNINYSTFLTSIIQQLNDPNPEIVTLAREALIEIGINSPVLMAEALVKSLTAYSSDSICNRVEIIKVLHAITLKNFSTNLISKITYTLLSLLTVVPPLTGEIVTECLELLNTFCKMNSTVTACEIRSISNNTSSIIEFFLSRIRNREMMFFILDNQPAIPFTLLVNNLQKTQDDKARSQICRLLTELSDVLIDTKTDPKILTPTFFTCIDVIMNTWSKGVQSPSKSDYYGAISSIVNAVDVLQLNPKFDKIVNFFNDALQNQATKKAAAAGLPSVLSLIERIRDKPKIQSTTSAKLLFDFIDSEYINIQTDGSIMRSINNAVGGLTALLNVYPKSPLDIVLNKVPQPASFYVLNYYCNLFGDRYAKEIGSSLSKVNLSSMNNETKSLYSNCFFTLIKKCGISYEKQEIRKAEEKAAEEMRKKDAETYNEYYVAPLVYVSKNEADKSATVKYEVPKSVPSFDEILMKVSMFIGGDQNDPSTRDSKIQFGFIMKQNPESFRYVYPKIFSYLMMPSLFFSSPTLISVACNGCDFIKKNREMLKTAKIDEFSLLAILLMLSLSDLFIPSTKQEFRKVISVLSNVDEPLDSNENSEQEEVIDSNSENEKIENLIHSILSKHDNKEYHSSLLKAAQGNVTNYINYGGDSPIHSPTNRSALLSSNAKLLGFLLSSKFNSSELDPVLTALIVQMSPLDSMRISAIAKFIGITASFNPESAVNFVKANINMIITNQDNKLKFWKKKEKPTLEPVSCTLAIGEILRYSPISFNDFQSIVGAFNTRFIESKEVPNWAKMKTIEAIINRNTSDPNFTVPNAKLYSTRCSLVVQESADSGTFISAVDALFAICTNNDSNIERPEIIVGNTLKFVEKGFKPTENVDCVSHVSQFIEKVVASKQLDNQSIILNFHEATSSFLTTSNWHKFVDSMSLVVNSFNSVKDANKLKFCQVISSYYIVSSARNSDVAKKVVYKLLSLLDSSKYNCESIDIQSPSEMAQIIFDCCHGIELKEVLSILIPSIVTLSHSQLGSAANSLLRAFATTREATEDPQAFVKVCIKHSNESGDAIVTLFKLDKEKVIDLLITETFSQNIATASSSLFSCAEIRHDVIVTLIERAKLLHSKNEEETLNNSEAAIYVNPIESALSILSNVKYSIPYNSDDNGEYILIELSIINLKLKYDHEKTAKLSEKQVALSNSFNNNITNSICDIFGAIMGDNSIFVGQNNEERKMMLSPQEAPQVIRHVIRDFVMKKKGKNESLFETAKKVNDTNSFVCQIVISIALGQILANKNTSPDLSVSIVDFLTQEEEGEKEEETYKTETNQINTFNRIIALSEICPYSESAKKCSDKIIEFVIKNFNYAPGPGLNAILRILPCLSDETFLRCFEDVLKIVEQALKSKIVSNLTSSNLNALKVLMEICSSSALSKSVTTIEKLWSDYPLFLTTFYFCQDFSIVTKCLDLFNNRLGVSRMTVPLYGSSIEDCFREFINNNRIEIEKAVSINPKRFVDNLIEKVGCHHCPDVRSLFIIFAIFIISLQNAAIPDEIKEKLKNKFGEMVNDPSEKVRDVLAFTLEIQLQ